jgi:hypothetical protein
MGVRMLAYRLWEWLLYAAWGWSGWRHGRLAVWHLRAESRLRREENGDGDE